MGLRGGISCSRSSAGGGGAAWALRWVGDGRAVAPLIIALRDRDPNVRYQACHALAAIGDVSVVPLIAALGDPDPNVRTEAAAALGFIGDARAVAPLIK